MLKKRKSKVHGWGVYTTQPINKNKRIIDYAGEKISAKQSLKRENRYLNKGHIWCFRLNRAWSIDAAVGGNLARFINHACKPNCYSNVIDGVIWICAARNIKAREELTYDYYTDGDKTIACRCRPGCTRRL